MDLQHWSFWGSASTSGSFLHIGNQLVLGVYPRKIFYVMNHKIYAYKLDKKKSNYTKVLGGNSISFGSYV